uniref:Anti-proliferative protein domain-containing protein n=1 Tax=Hemiselmis andersenii TaxID=464988 RepID=A0A6U4MLV1_HEMAN
MSKNVDYPSPHDPHLLTSEAYGFATHCHFVPDREDDHPIPSLPHSPGLNSWENAGPQEGGEEANYAPFLGGVGVGSDQAVFDQGLLHVGRAVDALPPWHSEVHRAIEWLVSFLPGRNTRFEQELQARLESRCAQGWHVENPQRGSGYRSIVLPKEGRKDPLVLQAAKASGVSEQALKDLPECVLWVDPGRVASRFCGYHQSEASVVIFSAAAEV